MPGSTSSTRRTSTTRGASEGIVGRAIKGDRDRWVLATKVANPMGKGPLERGLSRRWVLEACKASLRRLGVDHVDVYYLHREDPDTPLEETVQAVGNLIAHGHVRYFGPFQLPGVADRRDCPFVRSSRRAAPRRPPALLQPDEPPAGGRTAAGLRLSWPRRRPLQPDRAGRPVRQVQGRARHRPRAAGRRPRIPG